MPIWKKNCKLETDFKNTCKVGNLFQKYLNFRSWKGRRNCEVGVNNGKMGKLK